MNINDNSITLFIFILSVVSFLMGIALKSKIIYFYDWITGNDIKIIQ